MQMKIGIIALLMFGFCGFTKAQSTLDTAQYQVEGRLNAHYQEDKPYVILISADGFRYDLAKRYHAQHLLNWVATGTSAASMIPSYPSITFPNHYSIITGLYPSHHGLIDNNFRDAQRNEFYSLSNKKTVRDGSWYGGVPLWTLAERQKMLSASLFWVGSESDAGGVRPTYYYHYNEAFDLEQKVKIVTNWLQLPSEKRPHLITFYFPEVDHALHLHGVDSEEGKQAVHLVDSGVNKLVNAVQKLGLKNVNFIFLSDHGMMNVDTDLKIPSILKDSTLCTYMNSQILVHVFVNQKDKINSLYQNLRKQAKGYEVYLKSNMPAYLHFGTQDDRWNRIGDVLLLPHAGKIFNERKTGELKKLGKHGYNPYQVKEMHAIFMAWGDQIKSNFHIPSFENVNVYPLIAEILELPISSGIDGKLFVLKPILKSKK